MIVWHLCSWTAVYYYYSVGYGTACHCMRVCVCPPFSLCVTTAKEGPGDGP